LFESKVIDSGQFYGKAFIASNKCKLIQYLIALYASTQKVITIKIWHDFGF
jgi:hypothetical protein